MEKELESDRCSDREAIVTDTSPAQKMTPADSCPVAMVSPRPKSDGDQLHAPKLRKDGRIPARLNNWQLRA